MLSKAVLAVSIVSTLPNLLLFLIPDSILKPSRDGPTVKKRPINWTNVLLCFAVGGLLGDVFLHILPHMLLPHSHSHAHEHRHNDVAIQFDPIRSGRSKLHAVAHHEKENKKVDHQLAHSDHHDHHEDEDHVHHEHNHEDHHDHHEDEDHVHHYRGDDHCNITDVGAGNALQEKTCLSVPPHHDRHHDHDHEHHDDNNHGKGFHYFGFERATFLLLIVLLGFFIFFATEKVANQFLHHDHNHSDSHCSHIDSPSVTHDPHPHGRTVTAILTSLTASGYLNLLADTMHNVTDGIAIGAAFANGQSVGMATFLSVICHEIPHELGDLSLLVQNGLSKSEAIAAQFLTAIGAMIGTIIGYLVERNEAYECILLSITSGGFLYIATVSMLPSIVRTESNMVEILLQLVMFLGGIGLMIAVLWLEGDDHAH